MTPEDLAALHANAMKVPAPWSARDFAELLAHDGTFLIPMAQAFALGRTILDEAELLTIVTHATYHRQGIARKCLAAFETEAARRGAVKAFLEVAATNVPARALYESAGWKASGLRKAYYRSADRRVDAVLMEKTLDPHDVGTIG